MNNDKRFHVRLTGELMAGADLERVATHLARLFKLPADKAKLLVNGRPRVVKKNIDETTARKFQVALRQAGARCELLAVAEEPPATTSPGTEHPVGTVETVGTIRTGGSGFSGAFEVAPLGADLATSAKKAAPAIPDTSHLSIAEPGADLVLDKPERHAVAPDVSHLSIKVD